MINYKKRFKAYLIDMFVLLIILFFVSNLFYSEKVIMLNNTLSELNELYIKGNLVLSKYLSEYSLLMYEIDLNNALYSIINAFFIIGYFVMIPYYRNNQTFGQKLMKIKLTSDDEVTIKSLMIRNIIINGLGYMLISLSFLFIIPKSLYFIVISILGIIQLLIVIRSCFMIIYKEDKKGVQDVLSNTYFIEEV